jgi:DNA replication protein DnaC
MCRVDDSDYVWQSFQYLAYVVFGDPTYADAILDRLVHNTHRIDLAGDSLRRKRSRSTTKD